VIPATGRTRPPATGRPALAVRALTGCGLITGRKRSPPELGLTGRFMATATPALTCPGSRPHLPAMHNAQTPSGGQPENLKAETSATRSGALRMSVHIPADWNPHTELLAIADYARDLCRRAEDKGRQIEPSAVREVNFMACLLAMRLSACRITIHREEAAE
jgi:hypothetical protein